MQDDGKEDQPVNDLLEHGGCLIILRPWYRLRVACEMMRQSERHRPVAVILEIRRGVPSHVLSI